jgi:hypothetical protein
MPVTPQDDTYTEQRHADSDESPGIVPTRGKVHDPLLNSHGVGRGTKWRHPAKPHSTRRRSATSGLCTLVETR